MRRIVAALICLSLTVVAQAGDPHISDGAGDTAPVADILGVTYAANESALQILMDLDALPVAGAVACSDKAVQPPTQPRYDLCSETGARIAYVVSFQVRTGTGSLVGPLHGGTYEAIATFEHVEDPFGFYLQSRNQDGDVSSRLEPVAGTADKATLAWDIPLTMIGLDEGPRDKAYQVVRSHARTEAWACAFTACEVVPDFQVENMTIRAMDRAPDAGYGAIFTLPFEPPVILRNATPTVTEPVARPAPAPEPEPEATKEVQEPVEDPEPEQPRPAPEHPQSIPQTIDDKESPGLPWVFLLLGLALLARYRK